MHARNTLSEHACEFQQGRLRHQGFGQIYSRNTFLIHHENNYDDENGEYDDQAENFDHNDHNNNDDDHDYKSKCGSAW